MEIINNLTQTQKRATALARNDFFGSDKQINFFNHIYTKFLPLGRIHDASVLSNSLVAYFREIPCKGDVEAVAKIWKR